MQPVTSTTPGGAQQARMTRQSQQIFSRLQALFPASPGTTASPTFSQNDVAFPSPRLQSPRRAPKFMKVRIVTWNMHDSLPKGDLEELLGVVSPHGNPKRGNDAAAFPTLSAEPAHPYHLVVVAGQECPSSSGIPMGLGAAFKLGASDKEREKEKEKDKPDDKDHHEKHHLHHLHSFKRKDKERDEATRGWKSSDDLPDEVVVNYNHTGWTSTLEHWLCHRTQANPQINGEQTLKDIAASPKRQSLHRRVTVKESDKGPYVPLIKERMMGLYLTVYIHRDLRDHVEGTSRSAVTAGLIGGRVGNKGGVGISLKIDGTTFLFLNAHLAAHEGKVHHRLANLAKIKSELAVDDFLQPDDPRMMAEDVTDRFDYTFLCGDLNFRLDITRLHADWLISRQEYGQALAFDQLKKQMETSSAFSGFHEAPINFPPTFKYDVVSRSKTKRRRSRRYLTDGGGDETEREGGDDDDNQEEGEGEGEARSLASSAWTLHSKAVASDPEEEDYFNTFASTPVVNEGGRIAFVAAAHKAKAKWKALLSPSVVSHSPPASPMVKWLRAKHGLRDVETPPKSPSIHEQPPSSVPSMEDLPASPVDPPSSHKSGFLEPPDKGRILIPRPSSHRVSIKSIPPTPIDQPNEDDDVAVYDSSHKQRVPSWCDRILWKSTAKPDSSDGEPELPETTRHRTRVSTFISQAFRPLSVRIRRDSNSSLNSEELLPTSAKSDYFHRPSVPMTKSATENPQPRPLSFNLPKSPRILNRARSIEVIDQVKDDSYAPVRPSTQGLDHATRRSFTDAAPIPKALDFGDLDVNSFPSAPALRSDGYSETPPPVPLKDPLPTPRWRFFPFRRDTSQSITTQESTVSTLSLPPQPVKGDVVCLGYSSLDDRGMRLLEGRSDHRPVIGSYAVYL